LEGEVDAKEQASFIRFLARQLKETTHELMAYQLFAYQLKQAGYSGIDEILGQARKSPALQQRFDKNFEGFDGLLPPPDPDYDEKARELLEKWKPKSEWLN
jgi:hypothetical protein